MKERATKRRPAEETTKSSGLPTVQEERERGSASARGSLTISQQMKRAAKLTREKLAIAAGSKSPLGPATKEENRDLRETLVDFESTSRWQQMNQKWNRRDPSL